MTPVNLAVCFAPSLVCGLDQMEDVVVSGALRTLLVSALNNWVHLRELLGLTAEQFQADLRAPSRIEDYDDPLCDPDEGDGAPGNGPGDGQRGANGGRASGTGGIANGAMHLDSQTTGISLEDHEFDDDAKDYNVDYDVDYDYDLDPDPDCDDVDGTPLSRLSPSSKNAQKPQLPPRPLADVQIACSPAPPSLPPRTARGPIRMLDKDKKSDDVSGNGGVDGGDTAAAAAVSGGERDSGGTESPPAPAPPFALRRKPVGRSGGGGQEVE